MGKLATLLEGVESPFEAKRNYIGASNIGHPCVRKIWYDFHDIEREELPSRTRRIFDVGHILEAYIIEKVREVTEVETREEAHCHHEYPWFKGHIDGYLPLYDALLEIKTANHASFQKLQNHGLRTWNEQYYSQAQSYMGLSGVHECCLLAFDKNSAHFHDEWVGFDEIYYEHLLIKAKAIHDSETMPPRVSSNALFYLCKMCNYREVCHV